MISSRYDTFAGTAVDRLCRDTQLSVFRTRNVIDNQNLIALEEYNCASLFLDTRNFGVDLHRHNGRCSRTCCAEPNLQRLDFMLSHIQADTQHPTIDWNNASLKQPQLILQYDNIVRVAHVLAKASAWR